MGAERFPLIPLRKNIVDQYDLIKIIENITVPTVSPYKIRLKEVPDDGRIKGLPIITSLSRTTTYPPGLGQFYINFRTGDVVFNGSQSGLDFSVEYYGKGSLVSAEDFNFLYDAIKDIISNPVIDDTSISDLTTWSSGKINDAINAAGRYTAETIKLTSQDITNKTIRIGYVPQPIDSLSLFVYGGSILMKDIDFRIEINSTTCDIKWDGMILDNILESGDIFVAIYQRAAEIVE